MTAPCTTCVRQCTSRDTSSSSSCPDHDPGAEVERLRSAPAPLAHGITDDDIRRVFLANGFTVKEGQTDLKPYVFAAARALLALAAPAPVALTPAQQHADELVVALRGVMNLHTYKIHTASAWDGLLKRARAVIAKIDATGQEGGAA